MKKQLLLAGALFSILQAQAQTPFLRNHSTPKKGAELLKSLLHVQHSNNTGQKPTGTQQRVIAQSVSSVFAEEVDSTTFKYTGTRGSKYDFNNLDYLYNTYFNNLYDPIFRFHGSPNPKSVLADSIKTFTGDTLTNVANAYYRTDNKIDSSINNYYNGTGTFIPDKTLNVFNTQGFLTKSYSLQQNTPGDWDTFLIKGYHYNSTFTRVESDSTWVGTAPLPTLVEVNTYHYSNNKLDSILTWDVGGTPEVYNKFLFTYNAGGKLSTLKNYDYDTGAPLLSYTDSLGYTSGVDYVTFFQEDYYEDGVFTDGFREVKFPGTSGLPDSIQAFERPDIATPYQYTASLLPTYNSYNNPTAFYVKSLLTGTDTMAKVSFYYETYEDGISGIDPVANNKDFNVYPNPFSNNINIDWKGKQQSNVTIRLTNIVGQEVYKTSMKLTTGKNAISIPSLNSGNYILLIQDADGKSWSSKMVKK
jgi:hypothetical protein